MIYFLQTFILVFIMGLGIGTAFYCLVENNKKTVEKTVRDTIRIVNEGAIEIEKKRGIILFLFKIMVPYNNQN